MKCTFHVENNQYNKCWLNTVGNKRIDLIQGIYRCFEGDIIDYDENTNEIRMIEHTIPKSIPGTILFADKMYGKQSKNKYYFKFIPYENKLPAFLIPCKLEIEFHKKKRNKYAFIEFSHWSDSNKHPYGKLQRGMGYVDIPNHTYEYLLACHNVYSPIKTLTNKTKLALKIKSISEWYEYINSTYTIEDRRSKNSCVFSIDPVGTRDIDDACSITRINATEWRLSIYISHVPLWLDSLDLWNDVSNNVSTIYLPHENKNMLPNLLSEEICSLKAGEHKFAFTLDIYMDSKYNVIRKEWKNTWIYVNSNDTYEGVIRKEYNQIFDIVCELNQKYPYMSNGIHNSHEVIQYMMTFMNCELANTCVSNKLGIFRTMCIGENHNQNENETIKNLPPDLHFFMRIWNSPGGMYTMYTEENQILQHDCIGSSVYMHATSPIRRLVDIINIALYLNHSNFFRTDSIQTFITRFYNKNYIKYINSNSKNIRQLQNESSMIHKTINDSTILNKEYIGYVIDITNKENHIQYNIYIPELKVTHYIEYDKVLEYDLSLFKMYKWKISYIDDNYKIKKRWLLTRV